MINFLILAAALFIYMNFWFVISLIKKRHDVADEAWGLGFVLLVWVSLFMGGFESSGGAVEFFRRFQSFNFSGAQNLQSLLITTLVSIWGIRLFTHIHLRHKKSNQEDGRYLKWRNEWGKNFLLRSYLQVFMFQGFLLYLISLPILFVNFRFGAAENSGEKIASLIIIGLSVWITGFLFQSISDTQLASFIKKQENKGQIIQTGLWKYSRHPNYFGEVTMWWGIWLISIESVTKILSNPTYLITIIGPLTITFLILKVSGIPMLEERMKLKPGFEEYKRKTSVFVPWFPKK